MTALRLATLVVLVLGGCTKDNPYYRAPDAAMPTDMAPGPDLVGADLAGDFALPAGVLTIDDVTVGEADGTASFVVRLSTPLQQDVMVDIHTVDGTAMAGSDYVASSATLTIPAGTLSTKFPVTIINDDVHEDTETFTAVLSNAQGAPIAHDTGTCTIIDDDANVPHLSIANASITEGNAGVLALTFTVTLDAASGAPAVIAYATSDGTATVDDGDYFSILGQLTIPAGSTQGTIDVPVQGDVRYESDEKLTVAISAVSGASGVSSATGTIVNDDDEPSVSIDDGAGYANVGPSSQGAVVPFQVRLSAPSGRPTTVTYTTSPDTASTSDYMSLTGSLTFAADETVKAINVPITPNATSMSGATFDVTLSNPVNATIDTSEAEGTIYNDRGAVAVLSGVSQQKNEGNSGTSTMTFTISIPTIRPSDISFHAATIDSKATGGVDYEPLDDDYTIAAGDKTVDVDVTIYGDTTYENDEAFLLLLSAPDNATLGTPLLRGKIVNDDLAPVLSFMPASQNEGNANAVLMSVPIELVGDTEVTAQASFATQDGSAMEPSDYAKTSGIVRIRPGVSQWSVGVPINGDTIPESDESFSVTPSAPIDASLDPASVTCTIVNDD